MFTKPGQLTSLMGGSGAGKVRHRLGAAACRRLGGCARVCLAADDAVWPWTRGDSKLPLAGVTRKPCPGLHHKGPLQNKSLHLPITNQFLMRAVQTTLMDVICGRKTQARAAGAGHGAPARQRRQLPPQPLAAKRSAGTVALLTGGL